MKRFLRLFLLVVCILSLTLTAAPAEDVTEARMIATVLREEAGKATPATAEELAATLATVSDVEPAVQKRLEDGIGSEGEYITLTVTVVHTEEGMQLTLADGTVVNARDLAVPEWGVYDLVEGGMSLNVIFLDMHSWNPDPASSCTEETTFTRTCSLCHFEVEVTLPAGEHRYKAFYTKAPSCAFPGERTYICQSCGDSYKEVVPMLNSHKWDDGVVVSEATCGENGEILYTCKRCGATKTEVTRGTKHTWDEGVVTKEATCKEEGEILYTCTNCGKTMTEAILSGDHEWKLTFAADSTCEEAGEIVYTCSVCGETKKEVIPPTGHQWELTFAADSTCEEAGEIVYTCSLCDKTKKEVIPPTGHQWDAGAETQPATCTQTGVMTYTCDLCGATRTEPIPMKDHDWAEEITTPATCGKDGVKTIRCRICGTEKTEPIPATGAHVWGEEQTTYEVISTQGMNMTKIVRFQICEVCGAKNNLSDYPDP